MNRLVTRDRESPLGKWPAMGDDIDRVFEGFFRPLRWVEEATSENLAPTIDIVEHENEFVVRTDLPGVQKGDINVTLENGVLTITAESKHESEKKEGGVWLRRERHYGKFARSLRLGTQINDKNIRANYKDGVLELILPKAEEVKPKKISVDVG